MAATTIERRCDQMGAMRIADYYDLPVAAGVKLLAGTIAMISATGFATPGVTGLNLVAAGLADETVDNIAGTAGAVRIRVKPGIHKFINLAGDPVVAAGLGLDCFVADNQSVAATNGTSTRSRAGKVIRLDADGVFVQLGIGILGETMAIDLTPPNLRSIQRGFRADFQAGFDKEVATWYQMLATTVPSTSSENVYAWLNQLPRFREWVGARILHDLAASEYTLKNKPYEDSFKVPMDAIEDDTYGVYRPIASEIGRQAKRWPDDVVADAILNGTTRLCFDGQAFFSASHPIDPADPASATYSNYYASGKALDTTAFTAVRAGMVSQKGVDGRPLGIRPTLLVVPPSLEIPAKQIVNTALVTAGGSNVLLSLAEVLVIPELEIEPTAWYLMDTSRGIMPFVFQERRAPRFTPKTSLTDDNVAYLRELHFLADARGAGGYALPFLAVKAKA